MLLQLTEPGQKLETSTRERKVAIGVDLGTTYSVAAMVIDERPVAMRLDDKEFLLPSAVFYGESVKVGYAALETGKALTSTKRLMGRGSNDPIVGRFPNALTNEASVVNLKAHADKIVSPVEVAAEILRHIKLKAEHILQEPVEQVVLTVPAYFDDAARAATKDAAKLAGLQVLRLINEPTAAALAYGLETGEEGIYGVYDLGGGTFDISLLKLEKGVFQVLATGGDLTLGGDDVDYALCEILGIQDTPENLRDVRKAKESLSDKKEIVVETTGGSLLVTEEDLRKASQPLVDRTLTIARSVMLDAGVTPEQMTGIILVGGSTRLKTVQQSVTDVFGKIPLNEFDPDQAVALGAALQAHGLTDGSDTLLLDVIPLSLGLETMGGLVEKILHRNSPIPAMAKQEFTTYQEGQTGLLIHVVQGEREFVQDCRSLARFELTGIPPMAAGVARVEIMFRIDADGLLTVSAKELTTGIMQEVEVKPSYGLCADTMAQMLEDSLACGREDMEKRLLQQAKIAAERFINELNDALKEDGHLLGSAKLKDLMGFCDRLKASLEKSDRKVIQANLDKLKKRSQDFAEMRVSKGLKGVNHE